MTFKPQDILAALKLQHKDAAPSDDFKNRLWSELEHNMPQTSILERILATFRNYKVYGSFALAALLLIGFQLVQSELSPLSPGGIDDWQYNPNGTITDRVKNRAQQVTQFGVMQESLSMPASGLSNYSADSMGFAVGGAKDTDTFRDNIANGYLPQPSAITAEGLFYDYYFDSSLKSQPCSQLFCPAYSTAVSTDPLTNQQEYFVSVGLEAGSAIEQFEQPDLNVVIVLDISGSMSSRFNQYYYDQDTGEKVEVTDDTTKMQAAIDSINALLEQLDPDDKVGVVLFDNESYLAKPISVVGETDIKALQGHISELTPQGGTDISAGISLAEEMLMEHTENSTAENRMVVLTDAMPNLGTTSEGGLSGQVAANAEANIHTTFVGIGLDFNTDLVNAITKTKGANYYAVHSAQQFETRLSEEFSYMMFPLAYDLELSLDSENWEIVEVYGSPEAEQATNRLLKVNTLFPSPKTEEGVKGGIILVKVRPTGEYQPQERSWWQWAPQQDNLTLAVSYLDRAGEQHQSTAGVNLGATSADKYDTNAIRKAVVLARWSELLRDWAESERANSVSASPQPPTSTDDWNYGAPSPSTIEEVYPTPSGSQWEQRSVPLKVSPDWKQRFDDFASYLENEISEIQDDTLRKEIDLINSILE